MRRSLIISATAVVLALPAVAGAVNSTTEISVGDDFFSPRKPPTRDFANGPSFRWSNGGPLAHRHNVRQDDKLFRSGNPTDGPIHFAINASAGSYHYYCELHRFIGMSGVVKVRPVALFDSLIGEIEVQWADSDTDTGSRFDVRYRVDQRKWKTWKNDTPSFHAAFGHNDNPVDFRPNRHTYKIKVRSERRRVKKHSDWSPVLTLNP